MVWSLILFFLSPHTQTFQAVATFFSQLTSCSFNSSKPGSLTRRFLSTGCNGNLYYCKTRLLMLKDTHTSQHLQTFIHSPVPEHKHSALLGFLQYSVVPEEMSFNLIWPPALELMGFQMGCQHSSSVHTSLWGMFIKVSHNWRLDVKTVGVSAKVWQTTSVCISCIFIFTIGF